MYLAAFSAALLAMVGALFGVGIARLLWADDLHHAKRIDEIRNRAQGHMQRQIDAQAETIKILRRRLGEE